MRLPLKISQQQIQTHDRRALSMKFTIRDLFLVTVIVAVCTAWWVGHQRQASEIKELKDQQEQQLRKAMERASSY